jgi:hypothetical protein
MAKGIAKGLADSDGIIFQTAPAGKYQGRITKIEDTKSGPTSKHPDTPMVKVDIRLQSDDPVIAAMTVSQFMMLPYAPWMDEEDNRKQMAAMARMYTACQVEFTDEYDTDDWMGEEVTVVLTLKEYPVGSGTMVNNISDILPAE